MHLIISQKRKKHLVRYCGSVLLNWKPCGGLATSIWYHYISETAQYVTVEKKKKKMPLLTNHVLTDVRHSVELLLTDFTWELLFCIAVHNLNVLMQWPQLLKRLVAGDALKDTNKVQRNRFRLSLLLLINMRHKTWWPWDGMSNLFHCTPAPSTGEKSKRA